MSRKWNDEGQITIHHRYEIIENYFSILNRETFLYKTSVDKIPSQRRIILDQCVFDIDELIARAQVNIFDFYKNPHVQELNPGRPEKSREFSKHAKTWLDTDPRIKSYAEELRERLRCQEKGIKFETVNQLLAMLKAYQSNLNPPIWAKLLDTFYLKILKKDNVASAQYAAIRKFNQHRRRLKRTEQEQLNKFIIQVPAVMGGSNNMLFVDAFKGGNVECDQVMQIFLWQFVLEFRPQAVKEIPTAVRKYAHQAFLIHRPRQFSSHVEVNDPAVKSLDDKHGANIIASNINLFLVFSCLWMCKLIYNFLNRSGIAHLELYGFFMMVAFTSTLNLRPNFFSVASIHKMLFYIKGQQSVQDDDLHQPHFILNQ